MPGAACPGVPPTGPPGLGQVVGGQRAHQLMLLLQLGLPVLAPLVPQLQLSHQGLALLAQSLLVFDQLQPGVEVRLLPCEARRPSLPSPRRPAHQILSLALPPGLREDPESGEHTRGQGRQLPKPRSLWDLAGVSSARTVPVPWLQGPDCGHTRSFLERGSFCQPRHPACGEGPAHCLPRCLHKAPRTAPSLVEDSRQTPHLQTPMAAKQSVANGHRMPLGSSGLCSLSTDPSHRVFLRKGPNGSSAEHRVGAKLPPPCQESSGCPASPRRPGVASPGESTCTGKFRVCPAGCVPRPPEDQLVLTDPAGLDPTLDILCPPAPAACPPCWVEDHGHGSGEGYGRGEHHGRGGGGAAPWGWCVLDQPWSPQRELLSVPTEREGGPQGRPMGPEISTKPKLVWNPVPSS